MWLFWLIVIVVIVLWIVGRSKRTQQARAYDSATPPVRATPGSRSGTPEASLDFRPTENGKGCVIGSISPFPVTLHGMKEDEVRKLVTAVNSGEGYEIREWFTQLIARRNIRCGELDEWLRLYRPRMRDEVKQRVLASPEWSTAGEMDRKDILIEIQDEVIEGLLVRPARLDLAAALLLDEPADHSVDDALLAKFMDNPRTYSALLSAIAVGTRVQAVGAGEYRRKIYEELHVKGFMRRGQEIPLEDILAGMTLKEMQAAAGGDAPKKFTRKIQGIEFLKSLPDIYQRLEKAISFRELFQVRPIEGIDLDEVAKSYAFSNATSEVILNTMRSSLDSLRLVDPDVKEYVKGWELSSDDCCPDCKKNHGRTWKNLPKSLPPFHIGCEARISAQFIDE